MKKLYNFRLDTKLIKKIDKIADNRTSFIEAALRLSLQGNPIGVITELQQEVERWECKYNDLQAQQVNVNTDHNVVHIDYLHHLEQEIVFLRDQNQALMLSSIPLLGRIKLKLLNR